MRAVYAIVQSPADRSAGAETLIIIAMYIAIRCQYDKHSKQHGDASHAQFMNNNTLGLQWFIFLYSAERSAHSMFAYHLIVVITEIEFAE